MASEWFDSSDYIDLYGRDDEYEDEEDGEDD